jgi:hypothetical protein
MISDELIDRLLKTHLDPGEDQRIDRRVGIRYPIHAPALLRNLDDGRIAAPIPVTVSDISTSGVGLVVVKDTPLSDDWLVTVALTDSEVTFRCQQVRRAPSGEGHETIGARLLGVLRPSIPLIEGKDLRQLERDFSGTTPAPARH